MLTFVREEHEAGLPVVEVLVDCSGSTDGSFRFLEKYSTTWTLVRPIDTTMRDGLAASINRMIHRSEGVVIVRMDADLSIPRGVLGELVRRLAKSGNGLIGPRIEPRPEGHSFAERISLALYAVQECLSSHTPRTTNLQVFFKAGVTVPVDAESEDSAIQDAVARAGGRLEYARDLAAYVTPPRITKEYLSQRVRCASQVRWYAEHFSPSGRIATQSPGQILPAVADVARSRRVPLFDLSCFLLLELLVQLGVRTTGLKLVLVTRFGTSRVFFEEDDGSFPGSGLPDRRAPKRWALSRAHDAAFPCVARR